MRTFPPLVLVVEDDLPTLKALGRVLAAGGFEPAPYSSAEALLASPPTRLPHCLVLDVRLGGMSGLDLYRRLQALGSTPPVIIMTAFDDVRTRDEAHRLGCVGILSKEADAQVLLDVIETRAYDPRVASGVDHAHLCHLAAYGSCRHRPGAGCRLSR